MPVLPEITVVQHRITEVEYSVVDALGPVFHSSLQGPPKFARCACGWVARWEDGDFYRAVGEHMLAD